MADNVALTDQGQPNNDSKPQNYSPDSIVLKFLDENYVYTLDLIQSILHLCKSYLSV